MNHICHWELQTIDPQKAKSFYEPLFGWKLEYTKEMNYVMIETSVKPGGGMNIVKKIEPSGTVLYVEVEDIAATLKKAEKLGGKTVTPKKPIPGYGFFGILKDTEGNTVGLFSALPK